LLRDNCPTPHAWFDIIKLAFATDEEHRRFAAVYTELTGLESSYSPERWAA
jgi:hypothetical protein